MVYNSPDCPVSQGAKFYPDTLELSYGRCAIIPVPLLSINGFRFYINRQPQDRERTIRPANGTKNNR